MKKLTTLVVACMLISCSFSVSYGDETNGLEQTEESVGVSEPTQVETQPSQSTQETAKESVVPTTKATQPTKSTQAKKIVCGCPSYVGKVKTLKVKRVKSKTAVLYWSKAKYAERYQIYKYSKKHRKYVRVRVVKKNSTYLTKLASNHSYYYKVRGYRKKHGKILYGKFSKVKRFKTKRTSQQKIMIKAKSKLGYAYVSGGSGPRSFDCSGFVYYVYKNSGVSVKKKFNRTSCAGMYSSLKRYRVKSPKVGDIVLYNNGGRFTHTAIYAGNGNIIHAANPRKDVCKAKMRWCSGSRVYIRILK